MRISNRCSLFAASLGSICMLFASATPAFAVERLLSIGHDASGMAGEFVTVEMGDTFVVDLGMSRSYSCEAVTSDLDSEFTWSTMVEGLGDATNVTARAAGSIVPGIAGGMGLNMNARLTLTPTTSGRFRLTVASAKMGGELAKVRCLATTLFGGYNTNLNDFNFLELTNIGNQTLNGTISAVNFDGTLVIDNQTFSIMAGRRFDVDIHTPAGSGVYGLLRVTHDGPLGTLQGVVSQYEGTPSSFTLRTSAPLTPFDQKP